MSRRHHKKRSKPSAAWAAECAGFRAVPRADDEQQEALPQLRVLFTTQPGYGHFHPLAPIAQALQANGHEVAFACARSFRPAVEACGFRTFTAGYDRLASAWQQTFSWQAHPKWHRKHEEWTDRQRDEFNWRLIVRMVRDCQALARQWRPDLIIADAREFGGSLLAELLGIPYVTAGASLMGPREEWDTCGTFLAVARRQLGLPVVPPAMPLFQYLELAALPPRYVPGHAYVSPVTHFVRPMVFDRSGPEALPAWATELPPQPTILATAGTAFNVRKGAIFNYVLAALRDEPVNLILTVGRDQDPALFGQQPSNVRIERYIPYSLLLPYCDLVITHSGWNTVMAALSAGVPMVLTPFMREQDFNAWNCARLDVGVALDTTRLTSGNIAAAVLEVLQNPVYRQNAVSIQQEIAPVPGLDYAVGLVERLAIERAPLLAALMMSLPAAAEVPSFGWGMLSGYQRVTRCTGVSRRARGRRLRQRQDPSASCATTA